MLPLRIRQESVRITLTDRSQPKPNVWGQPGCLFCASIHRGYAIEDNVITAFTNVGSWRISKKGEKNILTYIVLTDPGGIVPVWIVEQAQMKYLPQMLIEAEDSALKSKKE